MHRKLLNFSILSTSIVAFSLLLVAVIYQPNAMGRGLASPAFAPTIQESAVYTDMLAPGWDNYSWNISADFENTSEVYSGTSAISVTYNLAWATLYLTTARQVSGNDYTVLRFWIHGGSTGGQKISVKLHEPNGTFNSNAAYIAVAPNQWTQVDIPLADLGNVPIIDGIAWQENGQGPQPTFYIDEIMFLDIELPPTPTPIPSPTPIPVSGPALSVDVDAERHLISEDIYGINYASEEVAGNLALPVDRRGGNATTRYNWQFDTANRASDWFFENIPSEHPNPSALPEGSEVNNAIDQNRRTNTKTMLTMPLIGWTPKARARACGFSIAKYGPQMSADPYAGGTDCGNGVRTDNSAITGNDPTDTSTDIDETFVKEWISYLVNKYGDAAQGGVAFYSLDNEPMLWNHTHRDVHPEPVSYDELRDLTYQYAAAIKEADPSAATLGPVLWGWTAYRYSAKDMAAPGAWWENPPDRNAHGGMELVAWYLDQMRQYEEQNGVRILDYLDLHYYPQATYVTLSDNVDPAIQEVRLRSTRSLWDTSYVDESWIGEPIYLIPRMKQWVDQYYPGTKLAITEYNWGALGHINGALAQADVLGIFGREGLDLATLWAPPADDDPGIFAFGMYRNYDGAGSRFGDISVHADSSDQDRLSIYAAQRTSDGALTLMVINKSNESFTSSVAISGAFEHAANAQVYAYDVGDLLKIRQHPDVAVDSAGVTAVFHANSITLIVIPPASAGTVPTPLPTATPTATPLGPTPTATVVTPSETPTGTTPTETPSGTPTAATPAPTGSPVPGQEKMSVNLPLIIR
ncbi:MAG: glycoside hydrolase family 44 protein [Caldilineaceae bacterium]